MKVTIVGSGDAFGTGGRAHTCFHVASSSGGFFIDYGASSPTALNKSGLVIDDVDAIFISHLHGDHFGGLPFAILDATYINLRKRPLAIYGPPSIEERYTALAEAMFPGMTTKAQKFPLEFHEITAGTPTHWRDVRLDAFEVEHPSGAPSHALRFTTDSKTLAYSGDSQWCENVGAAGRNADLFLLECYAFDRQVPYHMNWKVIAAQLPAIGAQHVVLTHMCKQMMAQKHRVNQTGVSIAHDGLVLDI